jgi:coenzyme F420 hydrogenase subunit beta
MKLMKDRQTIGEVVKQGPCTGCGTCAGICPASAIWMERDERKGIYIPKLIEEECNQCGICLDACPGRFVDFDKLNLEIFGKEPKDILLGNYTSCYLAHAADSQIRYNSASGGMVTSLLLFALGQGLIDGALVTRMKKDSPLEPESFIARTREDILQASGSRYCPVPANIAIQEILEKDGKYAVVGLPCHISGIRKAEAVSPILRERISLHLGIFCSHTATFRGTEFLLRKLGIRKEEVAEISYRGGGWPGGVTIKLKNGGARFIPNQGSLWNTIFSGFFFTPSGCLSCNDVTNELSDVSFGDPWLPEIMATEKTGRSVVISRSEQGEAVLHAASSKGAIELSALDAKDAIRSQRLFLHFKKVNINSRRRSPEFLGKRADTSSRKGVSLYNKLVAAIALTNSRLASSKLGGFLLSNIPLKILRVYTNAFYRLYFRVIDKDFDKFGRNALRILILNAHWGNRGDEAAIRAMIDSLRTEIPVKKMWVMVMAQRAEQFPYDDIERLEIYPKWTKLDLADAVFNILTFGRFSLNKRGREFLRVINEADVVIHAPGGPSIGDLYGGGLLGYLYLYRLLIAKVFKKKLLFFYAPSMGPFSGRLRNWARKLILKRADAIILRDEISLGYLRDQLGLEACVALDAAFQNNVPEDYLQRYNDLSQTLELLKGGRTVGIVITDLKWHPVYRYSEGLAERIMACCSNVAKYLLEKGYSILLIPQLFGNKSMQQAAETQLLERIREVDKRQIYICPPDIDSYGQQVIISKLFALISMRYHPVVFAAKGNTPFISIYYEHKAEGFVQRVGLTDFAIRIEDISASEIIDRFTILEQNYDEVKERLRAVNPLLKEQSRKTTRIIVDKLRELGWRINRAG